MYIAIWKNFNAKFFLNYGTSKSRLSLLQKGPSEMSNKTTTILQGDTNISSVTSLEAPPTPHPPPVVPFSGEAQLVVDNEVDGASHVKVRQVWEGEGLGDDALPGESSVSVDQNTEHLPTHTSDSTSCRMYGTTALRCYIVIVMAFSIRGSIYSQNCIFYHCNFNNSQSARNIIFWP